MIVVPIKEGDNLERALKKLKRKFEKTGVVKEMRRRQQFTKPSVINREKWTTRIEKKEKPRSIASGLFA